MVDPVGAAVGITTLILQVAEDVIKGDQYSKKNLKCRIIWDCK